MCIPPACTTCQQTQCEQARYLNAPRLHRSAAEFLENPSRSLKHFGKKAKKSIKNQLSSLHLTACRPGQFLSKIARTLYKWTNIKTFRLFKTLEKVQATSWDTSIGKRDYKWISLATLQEWTNRPVPRSTLSQNVSFYKTAGRASGVWTVWSHWRRRV